MTIKTRKQAKSIRRKGYNMERDTILWFLKQGIFAKRNTSRQQKEKTIYGDMRACDIIASTGYGPLFVQAKYNKKDFTKAERLGLEALAIRFSGNSALMYRDKGKGIQIEYLHMLPRP